MKRSDNLAEKKLCGRIGATAIMFILMAVTAFAADNEWTSVVQPIIEFLNKLLPPVIAVVGAVGTLYCVLLGVKFAKAEEPQDREKAKTHLKNAIIGFVLIFVLIVVLQLSTDPLLNWVKNATGTNLGTGFIGI